MRRSASKKNYRLMASSVQKDHFAEIRRTLQLAAPVIIGQLAGFGMNFIDTVMAGRLEEREVALSALGIGGAIWSALLMFVLGTLLAVQPVVAQLDGADKKAEAGSATRQALWIALVMAVPFWFLLRNSGPVLHWLEIDPAIIPTATGYLKALAWGGPAMCLVFLLRYFSEGSGFTRLTMYIGFLGVILNIPFNYALMYGRWGMPALGAVGCGYATSMVLWLQVLLLYFFIRSHKHFKPFELFAQWEWPQWPRIKELLSVGLPIAVMIFVEGSLFIAAALFIGRLGTVPSAAHLIAINFSALVFMIPLGLASAITIRVGNAIGRGDPEAARYAGFIGLLVVLGIQSVSASMMFLIPESIVAIYTDRPHPEVAALAVNLLFFAAIFQFSDGIQVCSAGALRGLKDTRVPMIYTVIAYWLIGMTLGYYLTFNLEMGPAGMWIGMIAGLTVAAVLLFTRFWRSSARLIKASA